MIWIDDFFQRHPDLQLQGKDYRNFAEVSKIINVDSDSPVLRIGDTCDYLPFVLTGDLKVHRIAENGREIILYHIKNGAGCILSALSILNASEFPATATSVKKSNVLLVPAALVKKLIETHSGWRQHIYSLYHSRFTEMLELIDEILFRKVDLRIARFLLQKSKENQEIRISHQELADEIGTSREVVSRMLKSLSDRKIVQTRRNRIEILNSNLLEQFFS